MNKISELSEFLKLVKKMKYNVLKSVNFRHLIHIKCVDEFVKFTAVNHNNEVSITLTLKNSLSENGELVIDFTRLSSLVSSAKLKGYKFWKFTDFNFYVYSGNTGEFLHSVYELNTVVNLVAEFTFTEVYKQFFTNLLHEAARFCYPEKNVTHARALNYICLNNNEIIATDGKMLYNCHTGVSCYEKILIDKDYVKYIPSNSVCCISWGSKEGEKSTDAVQLNFLNGIVLTIKYPRDISYPKIDDIKSSIHNDNPSYSLNISQDFVDWLKQYGNIKDCHCKLSLIKGTFTAQIMKTGVESWDKKISKVPIYSENMCGHSDNSFIFVLYRLVNILTLAYSFSSVLTIKSDIKTNNLISYITYWKVSSPLPIRYGILTASRQLN